MKEFFEIISRYIVQMKNISDIDDEDSEDEPEIDESYLNSDNELIMKKEVEE